MKPNAPQRAAADPAAAAIASVLRAEREARQSIESARREAQSIAEQARASARALAERTERRIRAVVDAFERELAVRLTEIDAQAARVAAPHEPSAGALDALGRAVSALAKELTGVPP